MIKVTVTVSDGTHSKKYELTDVTPKGKGKRLHFQPSESAVLEGFGKIYVKQDAPLTDTKK